MVCFASIPSTITYVRETPVQKEIVLETFTASVSAYTSDPGETDDEPLITASGTTVDEETIACPSRLAFGTIVRIQGKDYECRDRMNKRYREKNHLDIWMKTKAEALQFGRKTLEVQVILQVIPSLAEK